jgi:hypothetical protein
MKDIFFYLKDFIKKDFHFGYYLSVVIILVAGIILNYRFDFKQRFILDYSSTGQYFFRWLVFFTVTYFMVLLIQSLWKNDYSPFRQTRFMLKVILGLLLLSFDSYSRDVFSWIISNFEIARPFIRWSYYVFVNVNQVFYLGILTIILKFIFDKGEKNIYGLTMKGFNVRPYFLMMLVMLPLVVWASFQPDFLKSYPIYKDNFVRLSEYMKPWKAIASFELSYVFRFVAVELFFRGFLVIGMIRLIGERAIMPMIILYSFWHFGKPMMETAGAAFAGLILGVIAMRTRSVAGGIIIHIGVALLMETAAFFQMFFNKQ